MSAKRLHITYRIDRKYCISDNKFNIQFKLFKKKKKKFFLPLLFLNFFFTKNIKNLTETEYFFGENSILDEYLVTCKYLKF